MSRQRASESDGGSVRRGGSRWKTRDSGDRRANVPTRTPNRRVSDSLTELRTLRGSMRPTNSGARPASTSHMRQRVCPRPWLAWKSSNKPQRAGRAAGAERVRDAVIDLLERDPLPVEPVKDDYLVTVAPAFEGEYEDMRYAWDHSQWRTEFIAAALRREHVLRELISDGGPRTSYLPAQFSRSGCPPTSPPFTLCVASSTSTSQDLAWVPLAREVRDRVEAMLAAADPDIRVADPDDPERGELFAGLASDAHDWVPAGVYAATGIDGEGDFRLIVGPVPGTAGATASAAFSSRGARQCVLNGIAWILEQHTEQ